MRLLVCGPRTWTTDSHRDFVFDGIRSICRCEPPSAIISGGAPGVDLHAHTFALINEYDSIVFEADWDTFGCRAGPLRNQRMLIEGKPDAVLAFQPKGKKTPGTQDMMRRARRAGIPVNLREYEEKV